MVDLEIIWLTIYGNDLGNHRVDVDDAIVQRCVKPKARVLRLVCVTPLPAAIATGRGVTNNRGRTLAVNTVVCAPDDGWWYHPKHVEQFPDKIKCVTLHLVGHILQYLR
jgi:hypothetical protein